ncbi:MAG: UDP-2,3-diacylglucosamine diphosphatase [Gammaproteobacteria bacterium]|nr:UDP-2,3-diacylglucosamine diphosphatase [Gammaproteobacteria bacterium]
MSKVRSIHGCRNVRTVFLSDIHLGFPGCSADYLCDFLRQVQCERLYLVGDIIDFWSLSKRRFWPNAHSEVVRLILRKAMEGTSIVLVPGNHDETLRRYNGMCIGAVEVRDHLIHRTADGRRLLVLHGDQFDSVVRCSPLLAMIGSRLYGLLLKMNTGVNRVRRWLGKDYWSLAAYLKHKVKNAVQYIGRFEEAVITAARRDGVDGVVCGHIHRAEISQMQGITYMNCGDWVESCTALVEHHDGRIELLQWREQAARLKSGDAPEPSLNATQDQVA